MRRGVSDLLPSMFHRRLLLLATLMVLLVGALVVRLSALTLLQTDTHRQHAEQVLSQRRVIPTTRGEILDRFGRVLASSQPGYDVAVSYPVISGAWVHRRARIAAWREHRQRWAELSELQREQLAAAAEPKVIERVEAMWRTLCDVGGFDRAELDRRLEDVKQRVQRVASAVWLRRLELKEAKSDEPVEFVDVAQPIGEQLASHAVIHNVSEAGRLRLGVILANEKARGPSHWRDSAWRYVSIKPSKVRLYPLETMAVMVDRSTLPGPLKHPTPAEARVEGVATHILGRMRPTYREDVKRRPFALPKATTPGDDAKRNATADLGGYLAGDRIGRGGIEGAMEHHLRGHRGVVTEFLDTHRQQRLEPKPGRSVRLTLDVRLQARIQAVMNPHDERMGLMQSQRWHAKEMPEHLLGQPLNGAAVVLEVSTGHVLASVSVPWYSHRQLREAPEMVFKDELNRPTLFRVTGGATGGVYQPGSTLKPVILAAAISEGMLRHDAHIECKGHLDPDVKNRFRCWIYKQFNATHGPLGGPEALARSCNIYFYTLGRRMGARRITQWYERFGLGTPTYCGLHESAGELPDLENADHPRARGFSKAESTLMGIGQGPVRWTPLQAANAYATLARGGYLISPTFIMDPASNDARRHSRDLGLDPRAVNIVLQGLEEAANEKYGTAHHLSMLKGEKIFNIDGVKVYGKSGTATAVPQRLDSDGDGRLTRRDEIVRSGDHSWFIGMVQKPRSARPDYVIAVIVEYAGSGGAVSGPIANQIMHAMRAEGYL